MTFPFSTFAGKYSAPLGAFVDWDKSNPTIKINILRAIPDNINTDGPWNVSPFLFAILLSTHHIKTGMIKANAIKINLFILNKTYKNQNSYNFDARPTKIDAVAPHML